MTEPLPCPFCGHVGLSHSEGSTFRWLTTECNGCGAQCGEERINTMTMERSAAIEQAKVEALKTWNTRAALEQQAEPSQWRDMVVVSLVREGIDKHKARELADHFAAQQQAEPVQERITRIAWDERGVRTVNGIPDDAPQRPWQGLTDEDFLEACQLAERGNYLLAFQRIQTKLKERNT